MTKITSKKITPLGKLLKEMWPKNKKGKTSSEEFIKLYKLFWKSKFWIIVYEHKKKNSKQRDRVGEVIILSNGMFPVYEYKKAPEKIINKRLKWCDENNQLYLFKYTGREIVELMYWKSNKKNKKLIAIMGNGYMYALPPDGVLWMKKNLIKK